MRVADCLDLESQREVTENHVKLYLEQMRGFVQYVEVSDKDTKGIQTTFGKMASQIEGTMCYGK